MFRLMEDVREWLTAIGFAQYWQAFKENAIDWELLPKLDQEILKDIGVQAAGHRIRILQAISQLDTTPRKTATASPAPSLAPTRGVPTSARFC